MNDNDKKALIELWNRIQLKRKELWMSQNDLSKTSWIDRSYISMVERWETNITYLKLTKLGEILGNIN